MKWKFACPGCMSVLNPDERLIFAVRKGQKRGIMLLSPYLGDYNSICEDSFAEEIEEGDLVSFSCPACNLDLSLPGSDRFAEVLQLRPGQKPRRVRFSQIYGEHATFTIDGDEVEAYGEHAKYFRDLNFAQGERWW